MESEVTRGYDDALRCIESLARVARAGREEVEAELRSVRVLWPVAAVRAFEQSRDRVAQELTRVREEMERGGQELARLRRARQWQEAGDRARQIDRLRRQEEALRSRMDRDLSALVRDARTGVARALEIFLELVAERTRREVERLVGEATSRISGALTAIEDYERVLEEVGAEAAGARVARISAEDVEALRAAQDLAVRFEKYTTTDGNNGDSGTRDPADTADRNPDDSPTTERQR